MIWTFLRVICLWVVLLYFAVLQFKESAPLLWSFCVCVSFSLGILATLALFFQAHKLAGRVKEIRTLCEGLYEYFLMMSILIGCLPSGMWRVEPLYFASSVGIILGLLSLSPLICTPRVLILGMRALRAVERKPEGE